MIRTALFATTAATMALATSALAQDSEESFGGAKGADLSIEAMEPDNSPVTIGRAGEYPADIARYLLASGAGSANLSPDGATIAFSWDVTGQPELWVMPASGGQPKQITFKTGVRAPIWTPDGSMLFFSADRDGNEQPGYFALSADGNSEVEILPAKRGDFRSFGDFAEDGSFIYASTARGEGVYDIYRGTMSGESELIFQSELGHYANSISPDGKYALITESVGAAADNLYLLNLATKEVITISKPPVEDYASHTGGGFQWWPNSKGFYFSTDLDREYSTLAFYDMESGSFERVFESEHDVGNLQLCGPGDGGTYLFWKENDNGFDTLKGWHTVEKRPLTLPEMPEGKYSLDCEGTDKAKLMVSVNGWQTPGEIWMIDIESMEATKVFAANLAGLDPAKLVRPQVVRMPARDGVELQGLLYLPPGAGTGDEAPPVLFGVHGGPSGQSQSYFNAGAQYHAARGVAVFQPNVRGSTGLGRTYGMLDDREKRLDSVSDLVDMLDYLGKEGLVDAENAAVLGGSYGGYMVNAVLAEYPGTFKAGVSLFGVADWVTALEIASPALKAADRIEFGDITEAKWQEFYKVNSPIRKADQINVPVLYSHGVKDPRIDIYETEVMVKTLRANGVPAPLSACPTKATAGASCRTSCSTIASKPSFWRNSWV
ncbi:MAG: prolyl oligopeptidase family serine peptidase [Pseudomonadota bacterium]